MIVGGIAVIAVAIVSRAVLRLQPAAPPVERGSAWIDMAKRQVRTPITRLS